mgnify:CR=1 FL=1
MEIAQHFMPMRPPVRHWPEPHRRSAARLARRIGFHEVAYLFSVSYGTVAIWVKRYGGGAS